MDLYAEQILDHYRHPRKQEPLSSPVISHTEKNTSCGDELTLALDVRDGTIVDVSWKGTGCAVSQAGMSLLSEELSGKSMEEAENISMDHVRKLLGVSIGPRRTKCAFLSLHALKNSLRAIKGLEPQSWAETLS